MNDHLHPIFREALAPFAPPPLLPFIVQIKCGPAVITEFGAMGTDSLTVAARHECLCELGQYVRVVPADRKEEPFPVMAVRHELETVQLRDLLPPQYSEQQLEQADLDYLANRDARDKRRLEETCDLERAVQARSEWRLA